MLQEIIMSGVAINSLMSLIREVLTIALLFKKLSKLEVKATSINMLG